MAAPRFTHGAEILREPAGVRTRFQVHAPDAQRVTLKLEGKEDMSCRRAEGRWLAELPEPLPGQRYRYALDGGEAFPDPASRCQPEGPHGPSEVVDPFAYTWSDGAWGGCRLSGQVISEIHIGTFTPEGTWAAAAERLGSLVEVGVTLIEMMPIADFPGDFGWGYDGVAVWAPYHGYGRPDDLRAFVDRAHGLGLGVILDVVYNHLGPDGNYVGHFNRQLWHRHNQTDWGSALNFDGPGSEGLRSLFIENAAYWIAEFHFDGLRLDATQNIEDRSPVHVLAEIGRAARAAAGARPILLIAENEPQEADLLRPLPKQAPGAAPARSAADEAAVLASEGPPRHRGLGLDALWNDDYHHAALVALTGRREAYYSDYRGSPQEFVSALRWGTLFQGQHYGWQKQGRGTPALDLRPEQFVLFLQNHDQVANSAYGRRGHQVGSPERWRAMTALTLLAPGTPLLFQGQEFAASAPFLFFAHHTGELARQVAAGRAEFLRQFPSLSMAEGQALLTDPCDRRTFERCRLDWSERARHGEVLQLHRDLLELRRSQAAFRAQPRVEGAVLGEGALVLRWFDPPAEDQAPAAAGKGERLLLLNLGSDRAVTPQSEPLLAPPRGLRWRLLWHSEDPRYGGVGARESFDDDGRLRLVADSTAVLAAADRESP